MATATRKPRGEKRPTQRAPKLVTVEQFWKLGSDFHGELLYGEVIEMSPAGMDHGGVANRLAAYLTLHIDEQDAGVVFAAETGFVLARGPDVVMAPDVAWVSKARAVAGYTKKFFEGPPDLAVEVMSPSDTRRAALDKVNRWLAHGTRVVWLADPETQTVTVHRVGKKAERFTAEQVLKCEKELPGFRLPLKKVFRLP